MPTAPASDSSRSPQPPGSGAWWQTRNPRTSFLLAGLWLLLALLHLLPGRTVSGLSLLLLATESVLFVLYLVTGIRQLRRRA